MPRLQAVVPPLAGNLPILEVKSLILQVECKIIAPLPHVFLYIFYAKKWSQRIIVMRVNFYGQLATNISPYNR